ncbi:MAG: hypothetical protein KGI90_03235 [Burkholderiales bacterium]|nr:hypothetical protein [Burkholderiales bacterium]
MHAPRSPHRAAFAAAPTWTARALALATTLACAFGGAARAQPGGLAPQAIATRTSLGVETLRLPQGESLGLLGATLLFEVGDGWALGPALYGAASGRRGGFFVGGVELQRRWTLGPGLWAVTGLYAGGGGGAAAPVGGGLMLRPAVSLLHDVGPALALGLSWSSVRFPSGQIGSRQLGAVAVWRGDFGYVDAAAGTPVAAGAPSSGLGFDRMAATLSVVRLDGAPARRIGLVGVRAERRPDAAGLRWGLEAAAAARGDAAGYMEVLGGAALEAAPLPHWLPQWRVGLRAAVGLGGGGAVPTGGGALARLTGLTEWRFAPGWAVGAEAGWLRSAHAGAGLRARQAQLWLAADLDPPAGAGSAQVVRTEWVASLQDHPRVRRGDGRRAPLQTVGLALNRYLGPHLYLSGQAHSAYAGGAGAYSVGLIGLGLATDAAARWRVGAEALAGAAGGGGVATAGGALAQAQVWASWRADATDPWGGAWRAGLGLTRAHRGGGTSPLAEIAYSRPFGSVGR